jgi:hypothetical protein
MTVYLAFSEHRDAPGFSSNMIDSTVGKSSYTRVGFQFGDNSTNLIPLGTTLTEGWFHFRFTGPSNDGYILTDYKISLYDATGGHVGGFYGIANNSNNYIRTVFTTDYIVSTGSGTRNIDMHWKIHATLGYMYVYSNGSLVSAFEGDTTLSGTLTGVDRVRLRGNTNATTSATYNWTGSEIIVSSTPTLGAKLIPTAIDADGAAVDWIGGFANINASNTSDTTYITSPTNGEISTFTKSAAPAIGADEFVEAVVLNFRSNAEPSSPVNNISPVVRIAGVNYFEPAVALTTTVVPQSYSIPLNPVTGLAWEIADINSAELGFRADT